MGYQLEVKAERVDVEALLEALQIATEEGEACVTSIAKYYFRDDPFPMNDYGLMVRYSEAVSAASWARKALRILGHDIPETVYPEDDQEKENND